MKKKFHLSKRGKLYLANIIALVVIIGMVFYEWVGFGSAHSPGHTWMKYLILQCIFTFCSLIIYYLSIIADALRGDDKKKDRTDSQK